MTRYSDNIYSGFTAATSAASSHSPVALAKTFRFPAGGSSTQTGTFPPNTESLTATVFIINAGSAATTDKITVSAGGQNLISFSSMGSAIGILDRTTTGLGAVTAIISACAIVAAPATGQTNGGEIPFSVTIVSVDTATDYQVALSFNRTDRNFLA